MCSRPCVRGVCSRDFASRSLMTNRRRADRYSAPSWRRASSDRPSPVRSFFLSGVAFLRLAGYAAVSGKCSTSPAAGPHPRVTRCRAVKSPVRSVAELPCRPLEDATAPRTRRHRCQMARFARFAAVCGAFAPSGSTVDAASAGRLARQIAVVSPVLRWSARRRRHPRGPGQNFRHGPDRPLLGTTALAGSSGSARTSPRSRPRSASTGQRPAIVLSEKRPRRP